LQSDYEPQRMFDWEQGKKGIELLWDVLEGKMINQRKKSTIN